MNARVSKPFWTDTPACVIGGTGFLGRHLVAQLLDAGAAVRTLSLPGLGLDPHPRLDARTGDVTDPDALKGAVAGARVVFLAAGPVGTKPSAVRRMDAHPVALGSVLSALPPSARLVLTSSICAISGSRRGEVLDEESPLPIEALRAEYARAKRAADEAAIEAARTRDVVIVNPAYLFGPDDPGRSVMGDVCLRFWRGRLLAPPTGGINVADVRDVATGHLLAAERGVAGRRYILGGANVRWSELFTALATVAGLRALLPRFPLSMPPAVMWVAATIGALRSAFTGHDRFVTYEMVRLTRLCWFVSSARAESELGYRCRPMHETLADAFAWHSARHRVLPRGLNRLWLRRARERPAPVQSSS